MKSKKKIEDIFDYCIERLKSGETIEAILNDYPEEENQLRFHLNIAQSLFRLKPPEPEVSSICRAVYQIGSEHHSRRENRARKGKIRTTLAWAAGIIIIVLTGSYAMASLADKSIPGDFLYPVKLATEKVQLALLRSPQGEVEMRITLSERRLKEVIVSTEQGDLQEAVLAAMLKEAEKAVNNANKLKGINRRIMLKKVKSLCDSQQDFLKELIKIAPAEDHMQIQKALLTSEECCKRCCELDRSGVKRCSE